MSEQNAARHFVGASAPEDPVEGDRWLDTHSNKWYRWCMIGDTGASWWALESEPVSGIPTSSVDAAEQKSSWIDAPSEIDQGSEPIGCVGQDDPATEGVDQQGS